MSIVYSRLRAERQTPSGRGRSSRWTRAFSSLTRRLEPMLADSGLAVTHREWLLGGVDTVVVARHADR